MRRVKINVFNNDYMIKTDAEEDYVREIARFLEEKVKEISNDDKTLLIPRPFLLVALKTADDFFRAKRELEEYKNRAEEKSKELVELLDRSLARNSNSQVEFSKDGLKQE